MSGALWAVNAAQWRDVVTLIYTMGERDTSRAIVLVMRMHEGVWALSSRVTMLSPRRYRCLRCMPRVMGLGHGVSLYVPDLRPQLIV